MIPRHPRTTTRHATATLAAAAALALTGCGVVPSGGTDSGVHVMPAGEHTVLSQYEGVLPCADCGGIRTQITLFADTAMYRMTETYLGTAQPDSTRQTQGAWTTVHGMEGNADAIVYQLDPGDPESARSFVVVSDSELRMLDREKQQIASTLNYSLLRLPLPVDPLGGRTWKWVALVQGDKRTEIENSERYTIRTGSPGDLNVQADCNTGHARYKMRGAAIEMGPMAMTFAMCAEGSRGDEFARMIGEATKMEIVGDTLEVGIAGGGLKMVVER